jgi:hypothetical protein
MQVVQVPAEEVPLECLAFRASTFQIQHLKVALEVPMSAQLPMVLRLEAQVAWLPVVKN